MLEWTFFRLGNGGFQTKERVSCFKEISHVKMKQFSNAFFPHSERFKRVLKAFGVLGNRFLTTLRVLALGRFQRGFQKA